MVFSALLSLSLLLNFLTQTHAQSASCPALGSTLALPGCSTMLAAIYSCDIRFSTAFTSCSSEYSSCYGASGKPDSVFGSVLQVRSSFCAAGGVALTGVSGNRTGTSVALTSALASTSSGAVLSSVSSSAATGSGSSTASASSLSPSPSSTRSQASPSATASSQSAAVAVRPLTHALYACVGLMMAAILY